jgi:glycosyltransferase involved in cell wall biosynthesis
VLFRGDSTLLDEQKGYKSALRHLFLKWVYHHIDYALYVGKNNKEYFLKSGVKEKQLIYAPHAIDNERFSSSGNLYNEQANEWRKELGIQEDDLVILFAGKLEQKKNPFFIISLANRINNEKVKFIIVGNGVLEKELKLIAAENKQVIFMDFQNQLKMPVVYRLADILILPSKGPGETWGLAANEAMASGCALMLSNKVGGAVDLIKNEENGIIFDLTELDKCVEFIQKLLNDKTILSKMKLASKKWVANFSYTAIADAIESLLKKLNRLP